LGTFEAQHRGDGERDARLGCDGHCIEQEREDDGPHCRCRDCMMRGSEGLRVRREKIDVDVDVTRRLLG
jgi:hypothetical protein